MLPKIPGRQSTHATAIIPPSRSRYLAEIAEGVRDYHATTIRLAEESRRAEQVAAVQALGLTHDVDTGDLAALLSLVEESRLPEGRQLLEEWEELRSTLAVAHDADEADDGGGPARYRTVTVRDSPGCSGFVNTIISRP